MLKKLRYRYVIDYFLKHSPEAKTELIYENTYQLLIAVVLSAQCTDKRINQITPALFAKFPDIQSLSKANPEEIYAMIRSVSYPNNKTKHLSGLAKMIIDKFNGKIPMTVEELTLLPGVGRKTANVITS